jgi:uncharacterized protein (UPF0332 family)
MNNPTALLQFAESMLTELGACSDTDAYRRAIINRMYYSAFHAGREFHQKLPCPGSVGNSSGIHEQLISSLNNPTIPKSDQYILSKTLSKSLRIAVANRVKADYKLDDQISDNEFNETILHCRLVVKHVCL